MNASAPIVVAGRVLLALIFVLSGLAKFAALGGTAGYIASKGLPAPQLLAVGAAVLEVVGGLLLAIGFQARWAALALAVFTLIAGFVFHNFWAMSGDAVMTNRIMFMKNLAIAGGLLLVFAHGAGPGSLDARRPASPSRR